MSFLVDPPLLYASGEACARLEPRTGRAVGAAALLAFLSVSVPCYLDRPWTGAIWRPLGARDGRDFMWNFPLLRLDTRRMGVPAHLLAGAIFATYPAWFALGYRRGRR